MSVARLVYTIEEAAEMLTVSVDTVYKYVESGQLAIVDLATRAYRNANRPAPTRSRPSLRFRVADLEAFLDARRVAATRGPAAGQPAPPVDPPASDHARRTAPRPTLDLPGADRYVN